jgi:hypothetical protein
LETPVNAPAPSQNNWSDMVLKWLTQIPALVTAIVGILVYYSTTKYNHETLQKEMLITELTARKERQAPFLAKQLQMYTEITQIAAVLASSNNKAEWEKANGKFWKLYYGDLVIVQSPYKQDDNNTVDTQLTYLGNVLRETNGRFDQITDDTRDSLHRISLDLARACRKDIQETWEFTSIMGKNRAAP